MLRAVLYNFGNKNFINLSLKSRLFTKIKIFLNSILNFFTKKYIFIQVLILLAYLLLAKTKLQRGHLWTLKWLSQSGALQQVEILAINFKIEDGIKTEQYSTVVWTSSWQKLQVKAVGDTPKTGKDYLKEE